MGRRGPAPKPTELKKLEGNPGKRPLNPSEVKPPPVAIVEPPDVLAGPAREKFVELGSKLKSLGLFTQLDVDQLVVYCLTYQTIIETQEEIERDGFYQSSPVSLSDSLHPRTRLRSESMDRLLKIGREFGFTPSARTQIHLTDSDTKEKIIEEFLYGE